MSIEPEDSLFEQALRDDLPPSEAEARVRRRLLAAGVALGHGIATTTAAASGAAGTSAAGTGFFAQALGLSWGLKLGAVAAVAIPTLGLLIEGQGAPAPRAALPVAVASVSARAASGALPREVIVVAPPAPSAVATAPSVTVAPERAVTRREAALTPTLANDPARPAAPSQSDFTATPEAPAAVVPAAKSTLADETRLLDGAFAALSAGDRARAAELIGEHESRYPTGLLSKERERAKTRLSELSRGP